MGIGKYFEFWAGFWFFKKGCQLRNLLNWHPSRHPPSPRKGFFINPRIAKEIFNAKRAFSRPMDSDIPLFHSFHHILEFNGLSNLAFLFTSTEFFVNVNLNKNGDFYAPDFKYLFSEQYS